MKNTNPTRRAFSILMVLALALMPQPVQALTSGAADGELPENQALFALYAERQLYGHPIPTVTAPTCTEQGYTTHTCTCGDSYVDDYMDATGHAYENGICTGCGVAQWDTDGDGVLEILAIGNSFSIDALEYAWQIAHDLGIESIAIGNLYISGCTLKTHATNAAGDLAKYTYYYNDNGTWTKTGNYKLSTALESRSWDYISMQQSSKYSGVESTYNEDLTDLIAYVKARSDAKLVWHMTWAYQQDSTNAAFPIYDSDQMTMYNAIVSAVKNKIVSNGNFDLIVPNGTAVQNSRTSLLGDTTTRDGYHMSRDYGQYLTGLLFVKTVTGLSVDGITYAPSGVDAQEKAIAIESVNNAYANPFEVTESAYTGEVPEEGYILLQSPLYKGAFWSSTSTQYNELFYDRSMSHKYFATIRFTREDLPVGSIIILADGWQYRPEGWITDAQQTGDREPVTTAPYIVVTEEWWGEYTIRAFNISKVGYPTLANTTEEEVRAAFQIHVPEARHSHAFENGVCTLCGEVQVKVLFLNDKTEIPYTVKGRTVTVNCCMACRAGYRDAENGKYIAMTAAENEDGSHSFTAPEGVTEVLIVIAGDTNGDGRVTAPDIARFNAHLKNKTVLTAKELFAADVNGDGTWDDTDIRDLSDGILGREPIPW